MNAHSNFRKHAFRSFYRATGDMATGALAPGDPGKAREFYRGLLAWEFRELTPRELEAGCLPGKSGHTGAGQGGATVLEPARGGAASRPPYFQVDDLDAVAARVWELGGDIVVPPTGSPGGLGSFCIIRDPCGAAIGLWQDMTAESSAV